MSVHNTGNMRLVGIALQASTMGADSAEAGQISCTLAELAPGGVANTCNATFPLTDLDFVAATATLMLTANASTVFSAYTVANSTISQLDLHYARTLSVTLQPQFDPASKAHTLLCYLAYALVPKFVAQQRAVP